MNTPFLPPETEPLPPPPVSAHRRVVTAYDRIATVNRPEVWAMVRSPEDVLVEAKAIDERVRAGERLPLAGTLVAVKADIDVAGLPTTAGGAGTPEVGATAIQRLIDAGALVLGKTNLGRFAGPAALELVDVMIGTATSGPGGDFVTSNGVVAVRPTRGLVPMTGMVPAGGSGDRVSVFAPTVAGAERALAVMTGPADSDPHGRAWPDNVRFSAGERPAIAIPDRAGTAPLSVEQARAFSRVVQELLVAGAMVETRDIGPFTEAGKLPCEGDPAAAPCLALRAVEALKGKDALLMPTMLTVRAVPVEAGSIGADMFTSFLDMLDMAAVTVPAGRTDDGTFGVSVLTRAFDDQIALDLAALLAGEQLKDPYPTGGSDLVVSGPYLRGQPLNHRLIELGARFRGEVTTAERYRMVVLPGDPPFAGIVPASRGAALAGERWTLSPAALGRFLTGLPEPLTLGGLELEDGGSAIGLQCAAPVAQRMKDITEFGCWRAYLRYRSATRR